MTASADPPHPVDQHVGHRVRELRRRLGLSQGALAQTLGLTFQQVQKYESGFNRVSASKLFELAATLGVEVGYFFRGLTPTAPEPDGSGAPVRPAAPPSIGSEEGEVDALLAQMSRGSRQLVLDLARALTSENAPPVRTGVSSPARHAVER